MPDDPLLPQCYITLDGEEASAEFMRDLQEVMVESSLHLPDVATIVVHDHTFAWADGSRLDPGKAVQITFAVGKSKQQVFDGEIVELELDATEHVPRLIIRAFDRMHRLARGRKARSFLNVTDGDLITKLSQEAGLSAQVGPTNGVYEHVWQGNQTNLEFMSERARNLGYLLYVQGKTLHCEPPAKAATITLEWGVELTEFRPRLSTIDQLDEVQVRSWDPQQKQAIVGQASAGSGAPTVGERRTGAAVANGAFGQAKGLVTGTAAPSQASADGLAKAVANRSAERFIEAEGTCRGVPSLVAGATVQVSGVGSRFTGAYFVTSAVHEYLQRRYVTHFSVSGQQPRTLLSVLASARDEERSPGLAVAIVTNNKDPNGQGRVKVKYPWLADDAESYWAPVAVPGGGAERGVEFLPEVNDEVLVGFHLGDLHCPYVVGGLWNGQDDPPKKSGEVVGGDGKVQQRIIRSRTGHVVTLDDSDSQPGITIVDKSGNKIAIDSQANKLTIEVKGDAALSAQGNLELKAQGQISIQSSTGQVQVQGMGVKVDGGAATVDIKGTMINLN